MLPYCLDRWRQYVDIRKKYANQLKQLNFKVGTDDFSKMGRFFMKWRANGKRMIERLNGMTQEELFNLKHRNEMMIKSLAQQYELSHLEIQDLKA